MPLIKLFGNLRKIAGAARIEVEGATAGLALATLCAQHPELQESLLQGDALLPHVRVMVNGHDIELQAGLDTALEAHDEIAIFPPIAGG